MRNGLAIGLAVALLSTGVLAGDGDDPVRLQGAEERVTVTATRLPAEGEALRAVPAPVSVFTREEIEASGADTVQEFLAGHASFNVFDQVGNEVQSTVALRGFATSTSLALVVDGVRVNEPDDNRAAFDLVPLSDVERIEVVRGNYSSVYGGGSLGGVIHVVTRSGEGAALFEGSAAAGSYGDDSLRASSGGRHGDLAYFVSAARSTSEGYRDSAGARLLSGLGRLDWQIGERQHLGFSFRAGDNEMGAGGALTRREIEQDRRQNVFNRPDREESRMRLAALEYRAALPAGFDLRANLSLRSNDVDILTTGRLAAAFGSGFLTETEYDTLALTAQAGHQAGDGRARSSLAFGGELRLSDFAADGLFTDPDGRNPSLVTANETDEEVAGLFLEETLSLGSRWSLSAGVRYDQVALDFRQVSFSVPSAGNKRFSQWSPRAGVNFNPSAATGLYASVAQAFLAPTTNQLFAFPGFGSNEELEPQTSTGYELGLRQEIGQRLHLEANLFRIDVEDEILFVFTDPALFLGQNDNVGETRRQGLELLATAALSSRVRGSFEYTFTDATFQGDVDQNGDGVVAATPDPALGFDVVDGSRVPMVPRHKLSGGVSFDLNDRWSLELRDTYVGDQVLDGDTSEARTTLASYNVLDAGVRYRRGSWDAYLRLRNLLDREFATRGITSGTEDFFTPAPEARLLAGVRFRL